MFNLLPLLPYIPSSSTSNKQGIINDRLIEGETLGKTGKSGSRYQLKSMVKRTHRTRNSMIFLRPYQNDVCIYTESIWCPSCPSCPLFVLDVSEVLISRVITAEIEFLTSVLFSVLTRIISKVDTSNTSHTSKVHLEQIRGGE